MVSSFIWETYVYFFCQSTYVMCFPSVNVSSPPQAHIFCLIKDFRVHWPEQICFTTFLSHTSISFLVKIK